MFKQLAIYEMFVYNALVASPDSENNRNKVPRGKEPGADKTGIQNAVFC